jgi:hypothetical protein
MHEITVRETMQYRLSSLTETVKSWFTKTSCPPDENYFLIN